MKILMISSFLPFPLFSGGQVRLYNLIRELSQKHKITLICEKRDNQGNTDIEQVEKICHKVITVQRRKQWSMKNLFRSIFSKHSFLVTGHTNQELREKIEEEIRTDYFDLIHVETFYVAQNLPETTIPVILADHNIEYEVYTRYAKNAFLILRPFLNFDIQKIRQEEEGCWKKAKKVVAVSEEDRRVMKEAGIEAVLVPNGVDTDVYRHKNAQKSFKQGEKRLLFIGDFKWIQNRDTVEWIIKEIWEKINNKIRSEGLAREVKLWVVGREIPDRIRNLTKASDIIFDEESSKRPASELFEEAYLLLAPIRVGGGTSYKIIESMSVGTPVVISNLSAQSLGVENNVQALAADTPEDIAENVVMLLKDKGLYQIISKNGREFIEKNYSWKPIASKLDEIYRHI